MTVTAITVTVVYSPAPRQVRQWSTTLPSGSMVKQALALCPLFEAFPELAAAALKLGIWGKRCSAAQILRENDRIEIYRPLRVDPKVARRERFTSQGAKRAGLFANKKVGAKAGYGG